LKATNGNRATTSNTLRGIDSYRAYYDLDDSLKQFGPERYAYDEDGYIKSKTTSHFKRNEINKLFYIQLKIYKNLPKIAEV